jgi:hypothetical protein
VDIYMKNQEEPLEGAKICACTRRGNRVGQSVCSDGLVQAFLLSEIEICFWLEYNDESPWRKFRSLLLLH